ncbi:MAG: hypothetical protein WCL19_07290 [Verrucomicrobiota bacterium]
MKINPIDVHFDPASVADPNGRVFWWQGEAYRGITSESSEFYKLLFENGTIDKLVIAGLIHTERTNLSLDGFDLVLRHRTLTFRSLPFEWSQEMFRDAAILTCDFNIKLSSYGLALQDMHAWNVMFDGSHPKFIDFCSIVPETDSRRKNIACYYEFIDNFICPLYLMVAGHNKFVRMSLLDPDEGIGRNDIKNLFPFLNQVFFKFKIFINKPSAIISNNQSLRSLRKSVSAIRFYDKVVKDSGDDCGESQPRNSNSCDSTREYVSEIIFNASPKNLVVVGSDALIYAKIAADLGIPSTVLENDEALVDAIYRRASKDKLPVLSLVVDVVNPWPACIGHAHNQFFPPSWNRLRGDMVLAMGVVYELAHDKGLGFEEIVSILSRFSGNYLIVEFIEDVIITANELDINLLDWYSLSGFVGALSNAYCKVDILPYSIPQRKLILCERKSGAESLVDIRDASP